jgi:hypothetical protein
MVNNDVDLRHVRDNLSDKSINTTNAYSHLLVDAHREETEKSTEFAGYTDSRTAAKAKMMAVSKRTTRES